MLLAGCGVSPVPNSNTGATLRLKVYGEDGQNSDASNVVMDSSGNLFIDGWTSGNLITGSGSGPGNDNLFLLKLNSSWNVQWTVELGISGTDTNTGQVALGPSGNVYVTGSTSGNLVAGSGSSTGSSDLFLTKYNSNGVQQWIKQLGIAGTSTYSSAIVIDSSENVYLTGFTNGNLVAGAGTSTGTWDFFIAKYDSSGNEVWIAQDGVSATSTFSNSIAVDSLGNTFVTGSTTANLVSGSGSSTGSRDMFVAKYDASGSPVWTKQLGVTALWTEGDSVGIDSSDNVYVTGLTSANVVTGSGASTGTKDFYLASYNSSGSSNWIKQVGESGSTIVGPSLLVTASNVYITGATTGNLIAGSGSSVGSEDEFIESYDLNGAWQEVKQYGMSGISMYGLGLVIDGGSILQLGLTDEPLNTSGSIGHQNFYMASF